MMFAEVTFENAPDVPEKIAAMGFTKIDENLYRDEDGNYWDATLGPKGLTLTRQTPDDED